MKDHPLDSCQCGDFRRQHQGGTGRCNLGSLCTPYPCLRFRLSQTAEQYAAAHPKHYAQMMALAPENQP